MKQERQRGRNIDVLLDERRARRRSHFLTALSVVLLVAGVAYIASVWYRERDQSDDVRNRYVVTPFDNRTGQRSLGHIGLITADRVARALQPLVWPNEELVPTRSVLAYWQAARLTRFDPVTRARMLAAGTRAKTVVHGSYYRAGDFLRFHIEVHDVVADTPWQAIAEIAVPVDSAMSGVDAVGKAVKAALRRTTPPGWGDMPMPDEASYSNYVQGLRTMADRNYQAAAAHFSRIAQPEVLHSQGWLMEALVRSRQYTRADSLAAYRRPYGFTQLSRARFMRSLARLRNDPGRAYRWSMHLAQLDRGDDVAQYELALAALAVNHPRRARRLFSELHPNRGALFGRPEYYLHYAAAYHLIGNHRAELRIVRDGQRARERALDVRLAYCRVRAAMADSTAALSALNALTYADIDTTRATIGIPAALEDCAAELDAHGLPAVAQHAYNLARAWRRGESSHAFVADSVYEPGYLWYQQAGREAAAGALNQAHVSLVNALEQGLPFYEPGRVMLHADPKLRRLHGTRAFLQLNQPQG